MSAPPVERTYRCTAASPAARQAWRRRLIRVLLCGLLLDLLLHRGGYQTGGVVVLILTVGLSIGSAVTLVDRRGWQLTADGLLELLNFGRARLHRWDDLEHLVIRPDGAHLLKLQGEVLVDRHVQYWNELVEDIQQQLWQRHGRTVPRVREVPTGAVSLARGTTAADGERGLSRSQP
ncbi:MAG: hypothetical protein IT204_19490 [Fimbriimonadaceae bacterium]|nr:hypothetical protein [Fimbriimonadaceae bacterium]